MDFFNPNLLLPTWYLTYTVQGISRLVDIPAGGDFLGLCDKKKLM